MKLKIFEPEPQLPSLASLFEALGHTVMPTGSVASDLTVWDLPECPDRASFQLRTLIEDPAFSPAEAVLVLPADRPGLELVALRAGVAGVICRPVSTAAIAEMSALGRADIASEFRPHVAGLDTVLVVASDEEQAIPCRSALRELGCFSILALDRAEFENSLLRIRFSAVIVLDSDSPDSTRALAKHLALRQPRSALMVLDDRGVSMEWVEALEVVDSIPDPGNQQSWSVAIRRLLQRRRDHHSRAELSEQIAAKQRELQRVNETLRTVNRAMRDTNRRLEELGHIKDELIGIAAHELKSPLAAMAGAIQILERNFDQSESTERDLWAILSRNNTRMVKLVNDILDLSRLEAGRIRLRYVDVSVLQVVEQAVSSVEVRAIPKAVTFKLDVDELPGPVYLDSGRLVQMLVNLLDNAVKFSPRDAVVHLRVTVAAGRIHFVVSDAGPGVPETERRWVFERFHHRARGTDAHSAGSGLGLTITRALAQYHGGNVTLGESPDGGARFTLSLPVRPGGEV
ncbi:MAG: HAMP domain-containing histidine kinase [Planctomycetes bacterium]|nr:HAMP domain-containing histidine kinase [Planctomycetota bacterium]